MKKLLLTFIFLISPVFANAESFSSVTQGNVVDYQCEPAAVNFFVVYQWEEPFDDQGAGWNDYDEYICGQTYVENHPLGTVHLVSYDEPGTGIPEQFTYEIVDSSGYYPVGSTFTNENSKNIVLNTLIDWGGAVLVIITAVISLALSYLIFRYGWKMVKNSFDPVADTYPLKGNDNFIYHTAQDLEFKRNFGNKKI